MQAVTVNFSVEALQEMKNAALRQRMGGGGGPEVQQSEEISSSQVSFPILIKAVSVQANDENIM